MVSSEGKTSQGRSIASSRRRRTQRTQGLSKHVHEQEHHAHADEATDDDCVSPPARLDHREKVVDTRHRTCHREVEAEAAQRDVTARWARCADTKYVFASRVAIDRVGGDKYRGRRGERMVAKARSVNIVV